MDKLLMIQNIVNDFFDKDDIVLSMDSCAKDIYGWDSLANIQIMLSIELEFNVEFSMEEMASFSCIGDIIDTIERKIEH